jgi:hypothetical protein
METIVSDEIVERILKPSPEVQNLIDKVPTNRWQKEQAEEWMRDNGVDFKDGRIVCDGNHSFIWSWEDEDDEIDNL